MGNSHILENSGGIWKNGIRFASMILITKLNLYELWRFLVVQMKWEFSNIPNYWHNEILAEYFQLGALTVGWNPKHWIVLTVLPFEFHWKSHLWRNKSKTDKYFDVWKLCTVRTICYLNLRERIKNNILKDYLYMLSW